MTKRILLTGATGFLGSHLAKALVGLGHKVIAIKRKTSSLHRIESVAAHIEFFDVEDIAFDSIFQSGLPVDAIIHTATNYGRAGESVSDIFSANTEVPLRLLDAGKRANVPLFINTDTILDKYLNIYALSKNQLLQWGRFFSKAGTMCFVNMRLEHFYGSHDDASKFTAYVINSCRQNVERLALTKGEQKRDFIYIDDVVSAYLKILDEAVPQGESFLEFEVGSGTPISIADFVRSVHRLTASRTILDFGALPYRHGEVMHSEADVSKLRALGWTCRFELEAGLQELLRLEGMNR